MFDEDGGERGVPLALPSTRTRKAQGVGREGRGPPAFAVVREIGAVLWPHVIVGLQYLQAGSTPCRVACADGCIRAVMAACVWCCGPC